MTVEYGTAFYFNNRPENNHLHFVISDPTKPHVMIVNITTPRGRSDKSCLLEPSDCGAILHQSRIAYEFAEIIPTADLATFILNGEARFVEHVPNATLAKIWGGALATTQLSLRNVAFLRAQGLLP